MKRIVLRSLGALAFVAALGVVIPASADAENGTPVSTIVSVSTAWTTWHATWVSYYDGLKSINAAYRASVQSARYAYVTARATATTKSQRQAALVALNASRSAAINARVSAILDLGDPPAPPAGYNGTAFVLGIQSANVNFRAAVTVAQTSYSQALAGTPSRSQRRLAHLSFEAAYDGALVARSNALIALGAPPANPGQPTT